MNNKIEEYKELRQEIRMLLARQQNIKNFAYIITLGVFGVISTYQKLYIVPIISAILIGLLWLSELRRINAVFRLATYIEIFIEKEISDLKYETISRLNKFSTSYISKILRLISNSDIFLLFVFHSVYGCIICYKEDVTISTMFIIFFSLTFIILGYFSFKIATNGENVERNNWLKVKEKISNNSDLSHV